MFHTEQHAKGFRGKVAAYATTPGDVEACERVRTDGERVGWRDAISVVVSGPAADYAARAKFKRRLERWIELSAVRRLHNEGRPSLGLDGLFEELAVLHCVRVFFHNQYDVPFGRWFVVMCRDEQRRTGTYQHRLRQKLGVPRPLPIIVQRLGRFGVVVPAVEATSDYDVVLGLRSLERRVFITLGIDLARRLVFHSAQRAQLYECRGALDAFIVWVAFVHYGWKGQLHGGRSCARLLTDLLGLNQASAAEADATSTHGARSSSQALASVEQSRAVEHIGRPRPAPAGTVLADL